MRLFDSVKHLFIYEERTYKEVYLHNGQLNNPMKKKKQYYIFKNSYIKYGFKKTFRKMNHLKDYIKYNPIIYSIFKK